MEISNKPLPILKSLLGIFIPFILVSSLDVILSVVQLSLLGKFGIDIIAGASIAFVISSSLWVGLIGFSSSITSLMSISFGAKNYKLLSNDFRQIYYITLSISLVYIIGIVISIFILQYIDMVDTSRDFAIFLLKCFLIAGPCGFIMGTLSSICYVVNKPKISMYFGIVRAITSIASMIFMINYVGSHGGAISIAFTSVIFTIIYIYIIFSNKEIRGYGLFNPLFNKLNFKRLKLFFINGFSISGSNLAEMIMFNISGFYLIKYGNAALASYEVSFNIFELLLMVQVGLAISTNTLTARSLGERNIDNVKKVYFLSLLISLFLTITFSLFAYLYRFRIAEMYVTDSLAINYIAGSFIFMMIIQWLNGINFITNNSLRAHQDVKFALVTNTLCFLGLGVPILYYIPSIEFNGDYLSIYGTWIGIIFIMCLSSILMVIRLFKYFRMDKNKLIILIENKSTKGALIN